MLQANGLYTTASPSDLGSTPLDPHAGGVAPGTALVGHLSLSLAGLAPGVYILQTTTILPRTSEATSFDGTTYRDENIPAATYTITIVPEPSTFALLTLGAIGAGAIFYRRALSKETRP